MFRNLRRPLLRRAFVAAVAAFPASDEADYVTGSTYYIDGALTQQVTRY